MGYGDVYFLNKRGVVEPTKNVNAAAAPKFANVAPPVQNKPAETAVTVVQEEARPRSGDNNNGPSISSGPSYSTSPPPPSPTPPNPWIRTSTYTAPTGVKQADPDIIINPGTSTSADYIVERFFEELGGTELINISRYDLIDGIDVSYQPIANLSRLRQRFNPNNIIALDVLAQDEFSKSTINLISRGIYEPYIDSNGNLVVEIDIMKPEENIDVQIAESGEINRIEL